MTSATIQAGSRFAGRARTSSSPDRALTATTGYGGPSQGTYVIGMGDRAGAFIFGYGSLAAAGARRGPGTGGAHPPSATIGRLHGFGRVWNVAMDNVVDIPGYKYYRDPKGGRPGVFVTFLNLVARSGQRVNGVLLEVSEAELAALDARERNYDRTDVTSNVVNAPPGRVWAYLGKPEARDRYERGIVTDRAVVCRDYLDSVVRDFGRLGERALAEFTASTAVPACPIVDLTRVDLGGIAVPTHHDRDLMVADRLRVDADSVKP